MVKLYSVKVSTDSDFVYYTTSLCALYIIKTFSTDFVFKQLDVRFNLAAPFHTDFSTIAQVQIVLQVRVETAICVPQPIVRNFVCLQTKLSCKESSL